MAIFQTRALVLKTQDYKESDRLIWFYTEKLGKISAIAKGAKKNRSKYFSNTLTFTYGDYILYRGKGMYTLNEGTIIDSFQGILSDFDTISYASYLCELIDISMAEEESNRELFKELVTAFYLMKNNACDLETLARVFEMNILRATGYGLNLHKCSICKEPISSADYISIQYLGGVCTKCPKLNGMRVSPAAYNIIKYLNNLALEKSYRVTIPSNLKEEIEKLLGNIIAQSYIRKPKSLETLNFIKRSEKSE
ncbi:DNA repair protein RecO [Clostridium sp. BSD9I1]|uniref:DNA repair protein RecO n=1 Tax=Clostridium sp. BSD9I1 TaxID=2003589 RepID=UPI001644A60D|nr:DNA repair protein RecO [Clostridium sp. BSD9I1]